MFGLPTVFHLLPFLHDLVALFCETFILLYLFVYSRIIAHRGFSGVDVWSVKISCLHWIWFSLYSGFQLIYTDIGFRLKLGFKKRLSSQTVVFTLNLISQNRYLQSQFLEMCKCTSPNYIFNNKIYLCPKLWFTIE